MSDFKISKFLGINLNDTSMYLGEASEMNNFRITDDYKAKKREGYKEYVATGLGGQIKNMWYGKIAGTYHLIFIRDTKAYKYVNSTTFTELGTVPSGYVEMFEFQDNLYFLATGYYKKWTGTGTISNITPYVPCIAVATPPAGGGTKLENINLLTGKKRQKFRPDGTAKDYYIAETNVESIDSVKLDGNALTLTTDYTVDLTLGKVTTTTAYSQGIDDRIEIFWTKGTGAQTDVTNQKYSIDYGGANDSRIMLYGYDNTIVYSGLADGVPSAEYFPANSYLTIGTKQNKITWCCKQYDRLVIYTDLNTWYTSYELDINTGTVTFPTYPLNDKIGSLCKGQLLQNNPFTIFKNGIYEWISTTVRDEKNASYKSMRIQKALDLLDLTQAITYDYEDKAEFWICVENVVWVYNYRLDVFYMYTLDDKPTVFVTINKTLYFGTDTGKIMEFQNNVTNADGSVNFDARTDNGSVINSKMVLGFMDFNADYLRKFLQYGFISIYPLPRTSIKLSWETDKKKQDIALQKSYSFNCLNFFDIDFSDFSFLCNYNPQSIRMKLKAKKFSYIKFILENNEINETVTIVSITLPIVFGGTVK